MASGSDHTTGAQQFYIPNLCAAESVMIMVILAELLVVVYVLGTSQLPVFDWGTLALASLFVQWVVLLCAGALCAARSLLGQFNLVAGVLASFVIILLVTLICSMVAHGWGLGMHPDNNPKRNLDDKPVEVKACKDILIPMETLQAIRYVKKDQYGRVRKALFEPDQNARIWGSIDDMLEKLSKEKWQE